MMNHFGRKVRRCAAGLGVLALCAAAAAAEEPGSYDPPPKNETSAAVSTPESVIRNWPERPRNTARALIVKYGEPSRFDENDLVWYKNGPWQKTVVYRSAPQGFMHGSEVLEQSIGYAVPDGKIAALKSFDSRIKFDKASGQLSSQAESESLNFLALNLADEIVNDKRSPDEARDFYRKTRKLAESGKSSAYTEGLIFAPEVGGSVPTQTEEPASSPNAEPAPTEPPYQSGMPDRATMPPKP